MANDEKILPECPAVLWYWLIGDLVKLRDTTDYDLTQAWEYVKADDFDGAQRIVERLQLGPSSENY